MLSSRTRAAQRVAIVLAVASGFAPPMASAVEFSWSGFATLGHSRSDAEFRYLRWIDEDGSFRNEAVAGLQLDAQLSPRWSATLQLRVTPAMDDDTRWDVEPSWGFLAWRPADGWLLRAGKLRAPLYLYSEVLDVGVAHDMARLPVEMYATSPVNEFEGGSVSYDWALDDAGDYVLNVTGYAGHTTATTRGYVPRGVPGLIPQGAQFLDNDALVTGFVLDLSAPDTRLRLGLLRGHTHPEVPTPARFPRVQLAPGIGYYKLDPAMPGPPIQFAEAIDNHVVTVGLDRRFAEHWRLTAEYARVIQHDIDFGFDSNAGYVALFREWPRFIPYISLGGLKSTDSQRRLYRKLIDSPLPPGLFGGAESAINAGQAAAAASSYVSDQCTLALGTSVQVPGGKLKVEWSHVWIDETSRLIDERPDDPLIRDRDFNVWTVNYNVAF